MSLTISGSRSLIALLCVELPYEGLHRDHSPIGSQEKTEARARLREAVSSPLSIFILLF